MKAMEQYLLQKEEVKSDYQKQSSGNIKNIKNNKKELLANNMSDSSQFWKEVRNMGYEKLKKLTILLIQTTA